MKNWIFILLIMSSCNSFFFKGIEVLEYTYVQDSTGCYRDGNAITKKKSSLDTEKLSFVFESEKHNIVIPDLILVWHNKKYFGTGIDGNVYTITYDIVKDTTKIKITWCQEEIIVSNKNLCIQIGG